MKSPIGIIVLVQMDVSGQRETFFANPEFAERHRSECPVRFTSADNNEINAPSIEQAMQHFGGRKILEDHSEAQMRLRPTRQMREQHREVSGEKFAFN